MRHINPRNARTTKEQCHISFNEMSTLRVIEITSSQFLSMLCIVTCIIELLTLRQGNVMDVLYNYFQVKRKHFEEEMEAMGVEPAEDVS